MSGLRHVVLALLTLSRDGCRSLQCHNMAAEQGRQRNKDGDQIRMIHGVMIKRRMIFNAGRRETESNLDRVKKNRDRD